jgi:hypothetical protein
MAGLEALSFLRKGVAPTKEWRDASLATLDLAAQPKAALEFPIIPSIRELVIAAYELPQLRTTTRSEWRKHIKQLASQTRKQTEK